MRIDFLFNSRLATLPAQILMNKLKALADTESGSAYIIGNGVSLKSIDFLKLKQDPVIGCNFQFLHCEEKFLNTKYYLHLDPLRSTGEIRTGLRSHFERYIRENKNINFFLSIRDYARFRGKNVFHLAPLGGNWPGNKDYSKRIIFRGKSQPLSGSLRGQISLAIYLGFSKATLLGHDYLLTPTYSRHFYEYGEGVKTDLAGWNSDFLRRASEFIDLEIVGPAGSNSSIPMKSATEVFRENTLYRENSEIISREDLALLSEANEKYNFGYLLNMDLKK